MVKIKRMFVVLLIGTAFASFGTNLYFQFYYKDNAPREPHLDNIYPLNVHGRTVYLTQEESSQLDKLMLVAVLSGMGAIGCNLLFKIFQ